MQQIKAFLTRPLLLVLVAVFIINQVLDRTGTYIPFVHAYLDDVLTIPLSATFILFFQRFVTYRNPAHTLPVWQIVFLWAAFSVWFEWYLPEQSAAYVRNEWDLVAYAAGGGLFLWKLNKPG